MNLSIVIPVYNVEAYLNECLISVQALQVEFEAILVDDGSTDSSGVLCDAWAEKDARFRVVHQSNGGLSAARNTGIRNSTGDYVLFLDSDDFLDPNETDAMLQGLAERPDVLVGLYREFYTVENRYEEENSPGLCSLQGLMPVERFLEALPADGRSCYLTAWRFVVNREFLLSHNLFFLPGILHEDEEWNGRMLCAAKTIFLSGRFFYQYRQARAGSQSSVVNSKPVMDSLLIIKNHYLVCKQQVNPVKKQFLLHRMAQMYLNVMLNFGVLDTKAQNLVLITLAEYRRICIPCMSGVIGRSVKVFSNIFGLRMTCVTLKLARKLLK